MLYWTDTAMCWIPQMVKKVTVGMFEVADIYLVGQG